MFPSINCFKAVIILNLNNPSDPKDAVIFYRNQEIQYTEIQ